MRVIAIVSSICIAETFTYCMPKQTILHTKGAELDSLKTITYSVTCILICSQYTLCEKYRIIIIFAQVFSALRNHKLQNALFLECFIDETCTTSPAT